METLSSALGLANASLAECIWDEPWRTPGPAAAEIGQAKTKNRHRNVRQRFEKQKATGSDACASCLSCLDVHVVGGKDELEQKLLVHLKRQSAHSECSQRKDRQSRVSSAACPLCSRHRPTINRRSLIDLHRRSRHPTATRPQPARTSRQQRKWKKA